MKEYIIPEQWSEVKLKTYQKFHQAIKVYENTPEYSDKFLDRASLYLCSIPSDELRKLEAKQFDEVSNTIHQLFTNVGEMPLIREFEIGETKYAFIPDLEHITYGEYIDLVSLCKDTWANTAAIMSILYRPVTTTHWSGKYDIAKYNGTIDTIVDLFQDKLTMDIVFGAISFFQNGLSVLLKDIQTSTNQTIQVALKTNTLLKKALAKNGQHTEHLSYLVEQTLSTLTQQQK
jgi:hypothetical protein